MVLLAKKTKMKRSKSSHPLVKSGTALERQKSFAGDEKESKLGKLLVDAEKYFARGEYENALIKYNQGASVKSKDEAILLGLKKTRNAIINDLRGTGDSLRALKEGFGGLPERRMSKPNTDRTFFERDDSVLKRNKSQIDFKSETLKKAVAKLSEKSEPVYNLTIHDGSAYKTIQATAQDVKEYLKDKDYFKMKDQTAKEWKRLRSEMNKRFAEKEATERYLKEAKILEERTMIKQHCDEQVTLIGRHYQNGKMSDVIRFAENFIKYLNKKSDKALPRKWIYLATAFNYLARSYDDLDKSRLFADKLYNIAASSNNPDLLSQSYMLSGKVYAKFKKYEEAALVWEKLIPLIQEHEKKAWLFHEIGRCYFELGKYDKAYKFGSESVLWANKCSSNTWKCTANVLLGQTEMKRNKWVEALNKFKEAKKYAELEEDENTLGYINSIEEVLNMAISRKAKNDG